MGTVFSCNLMHLIGKCSSQKVTLNEMINFQHLFAEKEKCKHLDDYRVWNFCASQLTAEALLLGEAKIDKLQDKSSRTWDLKFLCKMSSC